MSYLDEDDYPAPRRKKSSSAAWLIAIFVGLGGIFVLLCCGGAVGFVWFGLNVIAEDIKAQLRDNPVVVEHLGQLQELEVDFTASSAIADNGTFVYRAIGSKGAGELTVKSITGPDGSEDIVSGVLRLPDGQTFDLFPDK